MHVILKTHDTDYVLPVVAGTWKVDKEPQISLYRYKKIATLQFHLITHNTTAVSLFCKCFTDKVWNLSVTETNKYLPFMPKACT